MTDLRVPGEGAAPVLKNGRLKVQLQALVDQWIPALRDTRQGAGTKTELSYWLCDLDDYAAVIRWLDRAQEFGRVAVHQIGSFAPTQHLPRQGGNVYFWRCDEYLNGLVRLVGWDVEKDRLTRALVDAVDELLRWFHPNGEYDSICYPRLRVRLPLTFCQGGATLEALWNVAAASLCPPDTTAAIRSAVMRSVDAWLESECFVRHGLFPNRIGAIADRVRFLPDAGRDGYFAHANAAMWRANTVLDVARLAFRLCRSGLRQTPYVKIMKDNSSMAFAVLRAAETHPERYAAAAARWLAAMRAIRRDGLAPMYWHPRDGGLEPMLRTSFTYINALLYYHWFVRADAWLLDAAVETAEAIRQHLRMRNGLLSERPDAAATYFDSQTDTCVSFCKLSEATGDVRWYRAAEELAERARQYHATPQGYVLSVGEQGQVVDARVSPRFTVLHAKSQMALEAAGKIRQDRELFDLLEDR